MTKEILNFKKQSLFDRLFITNYFVAIIFLIYNCVVSTFLPSSNTTWYGYWNINQSLSILGIFSIVLNILLTIYFLSFSIARFVKKPYFTNFEDQEKFMKRNYNYLKFNIPVITCIWVVMIIGLINKPGLITFTITNNTNTISFLFSNITSYFETTALVTFIIIAMLWLGILTQLSKDVWEYIKNQKYQKKYDAKCN